VGRCWSLLLLLVAVDCRRTNHGQSTEADATPAATSPTGVSASAAPALVPSTAPAPEGSGGDPTLDGCREQSPQDFLVRKNYLVKPGASPAEQTARLARREQSVRYRTERYGHFPGFGSAEQNSHSPRYYAADTTFMGFSLTLNRRVIPALACVELAIRRDCASQPYRPHRVLGIRNHNTYKDYEISNHVYGIAVDIDPDVNTCCGCVPPWNHHPLCSDKSRSVYQRLAMPECWVRQFERYGFYWLGHDELEDTMHFEFLGDPDRIAG
jgi:hypothetical protein